MALKKPRLVRHRLHFYQRYYIKFKRFIRPALINKHNHVKKKLCSYATRGGGGGGGGGEGGAKTRPAPHSSTAHFTVHSPLLG